MDTKKLKFNYLIEQAYAPFGESHAQVKERYNDMPMCLLEYIEKDIHNELIEISFDEQNGSVTYHFDKNRMLEFASIYLYDSSDIDLFISFLEKFADGYNYIKKYWVINKCFYMTVHQTEYGTYFYCYKMTEQ